MSQVNTGDFPIDPQVTSGTQLAEILNRWFNASNTQNSGATEPTTTYPGMFWYDTSMNPPVLKIRNSGNTGWVDFADSLAITPADITGLGTMATVNSPVPVANGGTAATTAAQALINLGADAKYVKKAGDTMTGVLNAPGFSMSGTGGGLVSVNINASSGGQIAFGWRSDGQLGLRVDNTQFNNVWPIVANNSNAVNGISGWTYTNANKNPAYLWASDGGTNYQFLVTPGNLSVNYANRSDRVNSLEGAGGGTFGSSTCNGHFYVNGNLQAQNNLICNDNLKVGGNNYWRWFWNGAVGDNHFYAFVDNSNQGWATLNSDERLKEDIVPLVSDEAKFMQLAPINFAWKKINSITDNHIRVDGLSAQNVRSVFPEAAFGDFDTPPDANGNIMFPGSVDDRAILAHVILRVQDLINRVKSLETV